MSRVRRHLSYANVMATIAVFIALGGVGIAAFKLKKNSVGNRQLKPNAVTGDKVADNSLTGADVNAATLGIVPKASNAENATHATNSDSATHATNSDQLGGTLANRFLQGDAKTGSHSGGVFSGGSCAFGGSSGASVTVNVGQSGFVELLASAMFSSIGPPNTVTGCITIDGTAQQQVFTSSANQTLYAVPGSSTGVSSPSAMLVFSASANASHTVALQFTVNGGGGGTPSVNSSLFVTAVG